MSPEPISITAIIKYVWFFTIVPMFVFLFKRIDSLRGNVYTKEETEKAISSQVSPILQELKRNREGQEDNTEALKGLSEVVTELRIQIAKASNDK